MQCITLLFIGCKSRASIWLASWAQGKSQGTHVLMGVPCILVVHIIGSEAGYGTWDYCECWCLLSWKLAEFKEKNLKIWSFKKVRESGAFYTFKMLYVWAISISIFLHSHYILKSIWSVFKDKIGAHFPSNTGMDSTQVIKCVHLC